MTAADAIRDFLVSVLPGWRIQLYRWWDEGKGDRYAVLRPVGGIGAELVRRPEFTLALIGHEGDSAVEINAFADAVAEAMRGSAGQLVFLQPGEPVFMATDDGRPIFEIAISAITN